MDSKQFYSIVIILLYILSIGTMLDALVAFSLWLPFLHFVWLYFSDV